MLCWHEKVTSHSERFDNSCLLIGRMFWAAWKLALGLVPVLLWAILPCVWRIPLQKIAGTFWRPTGWAFHIDTDLGQGPEIGNAIIQMSALVLLLGAPLLSGDIASLLLCCLCCVACGPWQLHVLAGQGCHVGWQGFKYLQARMAARRVLGFGLVLSSGSEDVPRFFLRRPGLFCVLRASTSHTGASLVLGGLAGTTNVECTRHPSKKQMSGSGVISCSGPAC